MNDSDRNYDELIEIIGPGHVNEKINSPFDFITIARKGIGAKVILNFRKYFEISRSDAASWLNVSEPTIYRWVKDDKILDMNYSVLLFELADLFLFGSTVFESKDEFFKWLELPNITLGGLQPKELLEIPGGIAKVRELLGRIEYGIYS